MKKAWKWVAMAAARIFSVAIGRMPVDRPDGKADAELSDVELYRGLCVQVDHPVLRSVRELVRRAEEENIRLYGQLDAEPETRAEAMLVIGVGRNVLDAIERTRAQAPAALEAISARLAEQSGQVG